jgi:hypothetical protein
VVSIGFSSNPTWQGKQRSKISDTIYSTSFQKLDAKKYCTSDGVREDPS